MRKVFELYWNSFELNFSIPSKDEWNISEDFNYNKKAFVVTKLLADDFKIDGEYEFIEIQTILYEIIKKYHQKSKIMRLDYLQKLKINWKVCWLIDNWNDICLMYPSEY